MEIPEEVRQLGIEKRKKETKAKEARENTEYIKNMQDTIYACKVLRTAGGGETTHLTDADTNEVTHCISKMHD